MPKIYLPVPNLKKKPTLRKREIVKGLISLVPLFRRLLNRYTLGTSDPEYCINVYCKHLSRALEYKPDLSFHSFGEIGPGDTLGVGYLGLLTGFSSYSAFDTKEFATVDPDLEKWRLAFLDYISTEDFLADSDIDFFPYNKHIPNYRRTQLLHYLGKHLQSSEPIDLNNKIKYYAPFESVETHNQFDILFSQAAFEHVDDLDKMYNFVSRSLTHNGLLSVTIDFRSHGITKKPWGHFLIDDFTWSICRGRRPYYINRVHLSEHLRLMSKYGLKPACVESTNYEDITRSDIEALAEIYPDIDKSSLSIASSYILAQRV